MRDLENTTLTSKEEAARQYDYIEKCKVAASFLRLLPCC